MGTLRLSLLAIMIASTSFNMESRFSIACGFSILAIILALSFIYCLASRMSSAVCTKDNANPIYIFI